MNWRLIYKKRTPCPGKKRFMICEPLSEADNFAEYFPLSLIANWGENLSLRRCAIHQRKSRVVKCSICLHAPLVVRGWRMTLWIILLSSTFSTKFFISWWIKKTFLTFFSILFVQIGDLSREIGSCKLLRKWKFINWFYKELITDNFM